jgi:hypothetical protein
VRKRRLFRTASPFVAALATIASMALVASGHDTDLTDPNDTRGRLDVREVRLRHQPGPPFWTIITFAEWSTADMWDRGYLLVFLDTKAGAGAEYYLLIRSARFELRGSLWRARRTGPDTFLGAAPVTRQSRRSASVQVGLARLTFGPKRSFYRWWVQTILTSDTCPRTCHDRAPNQGTVRQWRPGMSPTPTPSPSPSP